MEASQEKSDQNQTEINNNPKRADPAAASKPDPDADKTKQQDQRPPSPKESTSKLGQKRAIDTDTGQIIEEKTVDEMAPEAREASPNTEIESS